MPANPIGDPAAVAKALKMFVDTVHQTGGVYYVNGDLVGTMGDTEWLDLAEAYLAGCAALGIEPKEQNDDDADTDE